MLIKVSRFFTIISIFTFLVAARGEIFGIFPRQEFLFQICISIALILYLLHIIFYGRSSVDNTKDENKSYLLSVLDIAVVIFATVLMLSTFASTNFHRSFFGLLDRLTGLINYIYLFVFYYLLRTNFTRKDAKVLLAYVSMSAGLMALYALMQKLGLVDRDLSLSGGGRPFASFTNPAILASYLLLGFFISLFGFWSTYLKSMRDSLSLVDSNSIYRYIFGISSILIFFAIISTLTRSTFLGLFGGLFFIALGAFINKKIHKRIRLLGLIIIAITVVGASLLLVQIFLSPVSLSQDGILYRLTNVDSLLSGIHNRYISWEIAIDSFLDKPLLGWGLENYSEPFDLYFDSSLVRNKKISEAWFDKVHGVFLEFLATTGAFGLLSFMGLLGLFMYVSAKMIKRACSYLCLIALVVAYFINGIFIFDSFYSLSIFFAVVAIVALLSLGEEASINFNIPIKYNLGMASIFKHSITILVLSATAYSLIFFNLIPIWGMGRHHIAWQKLNELDTEAVAYYEKDFKLSHPYGPYDWQYLAILLLKNEKNYVNQSEDYYQDMVRFTFDSFKELENKYNPGTRDYYMAGRLGNFLNEKSKADKQLMLGYLNKAQAFSPDKPDVYYEIAQYYKNEGDFVKALDKLKEILKKDPEVAFTHANLGYAYVLNNDFENAVYSFETAIEKGYNSWMIDPGHIQYLIQVYTYEGVIEGHYERLVQFYELLNGLGVQSAQNYTQLAALYKELGDYENAIDVALKAIEIAPHIREEAEAFISEIEALQ